MLSSKAFPSLQDQKQEGSITGARHHKRQPPNPTCYSECLKAGRIPAAISLSSISIRLFLGINREMLDLTSNESGRTLLVLKHICHGNLHELEPSFLSLLQNLASIHFNELAHPERLILFYGIYYILS